MMIKQWLLGFQFLSLDFFSLLIILYSAGIDPVKQETVQLIKGNITLERDPIIGAVKLTIAGYSSFLQFSFNGSYKETRN